MDRARHRQPHLVGNLERQGGELHAHIWQVPNYGRPLQSREIKI